MSNYDYIVIGAGSAGCAVAGRLSEDADRKVLLIEAGRDDDTQFVRKPGMIAVMHTVPQVKKKFDWGYYTEPNSHTIGRKIPYTRGKVLGGSSAVNGMVYVRGNRKNYDDWAAEGCEGCRAISAVEGTCPAVIRWSLTQIRSKNDVGFAHM